MLTPPSTGAANRAALPLVGEERAGRDAWDPAAAGLGCRALPPDPGSGEGWGCPKRCSLHVPPCQAGPICRGAVGMAPSSGWEPGRG